MFIKYGSWLPGVLMVEDENLIIPSELNTDLSGLKDLLAQRGGRFSSVFSHKNVIFAARNGEVINDESSLQDSDVITFFSPIAGG